MKEKLSLRGSVELKPNLAKDDLYLNWMKKYLNILKKDMNLLSR